MTSVIRIYRTHSALLFAKLNILEIFQVKSFPLAKYYHNQLLSPIFLNLFATNSQVQNYGTGTPVVIDHPIVT